MKKQYIVFSCLNEQVLLFRTGRCLWSGYVFYEPPEAELVGSVDIFQDDSPSFCEQFFFYRLTLLNKENPFKALLNSSGWMFNCWFPFNALSDLDEIDCIQKAIIPLMVEPQAFKVALHFKDKKRVHIQRIEIASCNIEDLLV